MLPQPPRAKPAISMFKERNLPRTRRPLHWVAAALAAPEPCALTFSIQDVVSREHDAAAHDVTFEAARTESVADPAAVKDLTIVCERGENKKKAIG